MGKYHSLPTWSSQDRKLSKDALVLQGYLDRCPTRTSEGLFPLSLGYVQVDTPLDETEIPDALDELSRAKLYDYDPEAEVVLDRTALRTNPLRNGVDKKTGEIRPDKRIASAVKIFESTPETGLKVEFVALADLHSPDLADAIREASSYAYPSPLEAPSKDHPRTIEGASREESESSSEVESLRSAEVETEPIGSSPLSVVNGNGFFPPDPSTERARKEW